jgi:hypothetical protein
MACAMQANRESRLRHSDNRRRFAWSQALPGDKQESFLVPLGELTQCLSEANIGDVYWRDRIDPLRQTVPQSGPPLGRAAVGRQHAPGDPQQPRQRLVRDLIRLAPSYGEGLRRDVIRDLHRCSSASVREHSFVVLTKDRF